MNEKDIGEAPVYVSTVKDGRYVLASDPDAPQTEGEYASEIVDGAYRAKETGQ